MSAFWFESHYRGLLRFVFLFVSLLVLISLSIGKQPRVEAMQVSQLVGKRVVLDPGHGWRNDPGATANGMREADIVLDVANQAKAMLEGYGIQVGLTRTGYEPNVGLEVADDRANAFRPDVVVSIHVNAGGGTGTESCYVVDKQTSAASQRLAGLLTTKVSQRLGLTIRGNFAENVTGRCGRGGYLYIHWMDAPAALIELAFVDGPADNDVTKLRNRRQDFAQSIADAVVEYLGGSSGGPSGYTFCANENQRCNFSGTKDVAYGANGRFNYRYGVMGGIDCNNGTFGDPIPGVVKACYTKDSTSCSVGQYRAEYYNNRTLSGSPTFTRCEGSINYDWGGGGPGNRVGNDNFSVRWTGRHNFGAGNYAFIARADDGIRVWVDGSLIIDAWRDQGPTEYRANRSLSAGEHEVKVEFYENGGGAVAQVRWEQASVTCPVYRAEYYNNRSLSGNPTFVRCENWPINHDWGNGGPGNGVGNDNFSVRWTGRARINSGNYNFIARADDGIRVWVGGNLIIDAWRDQPPTEYRVGRYISAGDYDIKVEYYENGGGAVAQFRWEQASGGGGPAGYTFCANENQRCNFSGTKDVAYGANGRFNYRYGITGGIDCNNSTFGDPIPGVAKACYIK